MAASVLPLEIAPFLSVIAQLGVILYMFTVALELNVGRLKHRAHATVATFHASILVPFLLGALLALALYPQLSSSAVPFTSFALVMGVAMSITAFPVLARILTDRGMSRTELGVVALSCAATDDVTAWCLLAFVVGVAKVHVGEGLLVAAGALAYRGRRGVAPIDPHHRGHRHPCHLRGLPPWGADPPRQRRGSSLQPAAGARGPRLAPASILRLYRHVDAD
jgi:Sodium/hydrogen exchanger family